MQIYHTTVRHISCRIDVYTVDNLLLLFISDLTIISNHIDGSPARAGASRDIKISLAKSVYVIAFAGWSNDVVNYLFNEVHDFVCGLGQLELVFLVKIITKYSKTTI